MVLEKNDEDISCVEMMTNDEGLGKVGRKRQLLNTTRRRDWGFEEKDG